MKTLLIASQKGGVGKTSLTVNLATEASAAALGVAVFDLDPQPNAAGWYDRRLESQKHEDPEIISIHAARLVTEKAKVQANGADLLIIDTPPTADGASLTSAENSDFILIPSRPSIFDLEAILATVKLAQLAGKPYAVVLNAVPGRGDHEEEARAYLAAKGATTCPLSLNYLAAFYNSTPDGRAVTEYEPKGKAATGIRRLFEWTCGQMGMETRRRVRKAA